MTVGAVVLTLDEEHDIERCLMSLQWCDDLVVVDSGSADRTTELAEGCGARVLRHRSPGTYLISEQRNWALDHAALWTDWVLFVDADEVVPASLADEIRRHCRSAGGPDAYQLAPKYLFFGQWMRRSMRFPSWHDRLLRRGAVRFTGGVWEHFAPGPRVGRISEPYLHYGNSKGIEQWVQRHLRYAEWEAGQIAEYMERSGDDPFTGQRRQAMRRLAARCWPLRPLARFFAMYVLQGGMWDGWAALPFCLRYAMYEQFTVEKVIERRRRDRGLPL